MADKNQVIKLKYDVAMPDGTVRQNVYDPVRDRFECVSDNDKSKIPARLRLHELQEDPTTKKVSFRITNLLHVVCVEYIKATPMTQEEREKLQKIYTFEVDFNVAENECILVDEIINGKPTGKTVPVRAVAADKYIDEDDLGFDRKRIRSAYKFQ